MNKVLEGYSPQKWIADGRFVGVCLISYGRARIIIGDRYSVSDLW